MITFNEGIRDRPEAIRTWFYPGANWGEQFVYPRAKAVELAKVNSLPVLAVVREVEREVAVAATADVQVAVRFARR